jgi:hypothetical protein
MTVTKSYSLCHYYTIIKIKFYNSKFYRRMIEEFGWRGEMGRLGEPISTVIINQYSGARYCQYNKSRLPACRGLLCTL